MENYDSEAMPYTGEHYFLQIVEALRSLQSMVLVSLSLLTTLYVVGPALFPEYLVNTTNFGTQKGLLNYMSWSILICLTACLLSAPVRKSIQQNLGPIGKKRIPNFDQVKQGLEHPQSSWKWAEFGCWAVGRMMLCSLIPIPFMVIAVLISHP